MCELLSDYSCITTIAVAGPSSLTLSFSDGSSGV